jgi:hypothetical protein
MNRRTATCEGLQFITGLKYAFLICAPLAYPLLPSVSASIWKCPVDACRTSTLTKKVLDVCGIFMHSLDKEMVTEKSLAVSGAPCDHHPFGMTVFELSGTMPGLQSISIPSGDQNE